MWRKALGPVEVQPAPAELRLLYDWEHSLYPPQRRIAWIGSAAIHLVVLLVFFVAPPMEVRVRPMPETRIDLSKSTPLIAPRLPQPFELTQKQPNRGKLSKEITLDQLLPRQQDTARRATPPRNVAPPGAPEPAPKAELLPDLGLPAPGTQQALPEIAAPKIPVNERPKLAFETPGADTGTPAAGGTSIIPKAPDPTVAAAIRSSSRKGPGGSTIVTDIMELPAAASLSPTPFKGRAGSSLELLSDPQGVDFKPYLIRVLAAVRRNWFAVIPASVKYGQRGKVTIQFAISREGPVTKLVISLPSGTDSLDRAAVAGISASNPFPPLPAEFKGDQVRLQLSFLYNVPVN